MVSVRQSRSDSGINQTAESNSNYDQAMRLGDDVIGFCDKVEAAGGSEGERAAARLLERQLLDVLHKGGMDRISLTQRSDGLEMVI